MVGMMALTAETLLVMAWQGIGNGLPLAAVVTTPEIAAVMAQRLHFNTYGGNPMCSAAGHAVLKVLDSEQRQQHCASVGNHLLHRLRALQDKHACIFAFLSHFCL
jgi:alanine-glyoxylate transaminase/(R)-3-amino-2-methylpropionate-pyruvate transaminase